MQSLPTINYEVHPIYSKIEPDPVLATKILSVLEPTLAKKRRQLAASIEAFKSRSTEGGDEISRTLARDGAVGVRPAAQGLQKLRDVFRPMDEKLRIELEAMRVRGERVRFTNTQVVLVSGGKPLEGLEEEAAVIMDNLRDWGVLEAGRSYYSGIQVEFAEIAFRRNIEAQDFYTNVYADVHMDDPKTSGMHIDSNAIPCFNAIVYLNEVGPEQGPFKYVRGSHRWAFEPEDRAIRKSVDETAAAAPRGRTQFMSLPAEYRRKAAFGFDLLNDSPESQELLGAECPFDSSSGDLVMFDGDGIHRGGNTLRGHRSSILVRMVAKFQ